MATIAGIQVSDEDAKLYDMYMQEAEYADRLQYVFKIKLNSLYGALSNLYFRFYDLRMGESTTATGRSILKHQCRQVSKILDGNYDVDFPLYETEKDCIEKGVDIKWALHGKYFESAHQSESVVYGDSVAGDSIIDTADGRLPIDQLFTNVSHTINGKEYCDVNNVQALTYDIPTNTTTFKPIKYVMRHLCSKQMYRVWITNSQWVDVTEDHSLMAYVNTRFRHKYPSLIVESKPNDIGTDLRSLVYVKHKPHTPTVNMGLSHEMYALIGLVLGDGYVDTTLTGGVLLSIGSKHIEDITQTILTPLQSQGWISSWTTKPNGHDIQISSVKLRKFLRAHLYSTGAKNIPNWMAHETLDHIASFMSGWFTADGFINSNSTIGLCSINESHIKDAQELLFKCGVSSTWFTERTENSFKGKYSNTYTKRLTVKSNQVFRDTIGFLVKSKQDRLDRYRPGRQKRAFALYDFEIVTVQRIEKLPLSDTYVYDIEVEDTHTFFANNILVHNTDSCYFKTHQKTTAEAIAVADEVAKLVNESFPEFMRTAFLCTPGFDNLIRAAREVVTDRGIFVQKKRYALHLVDVDGKAVDKMKVMGLDTKKTILPKQISADLNKFIEDWLKGQSWEDVSERLVKYKEDLVNGGLIIKYGLPTGVNNVEQYTALYLKEGIKARLPGGVAAAIHYNQALKEYNDMISPPITSGSKMRKYYLKNKVGKFKTIALPTDLIDIPDWFINNYPIDNKAMILRLVDNPVRNIVKAVGKVPPTRQTLLDAKLVEY